jgi:hypothetical protein
MNSKANLGITMHHYSLPILPVLGTIPFGPRHFPNSLKLRIVRFCKVKIAPEDEQFLRTQG